MKYFLFCAFAFFISLLATGCIKRIGDTGYYLNDDFYTIENNTKEIPGNILAGIHGAYYNDSYIITYSLNYEYEIVRYYIIELGGIKKDNIWAMEYKEDYFQLRDSLGLKEKEMKLVQW